MNDTDVTFGSFFIGFFLGYMSIVCSYGGFLFGLITGIILQSITPQIGQSTIIHVGNTFEQTQIFLKYLCEKKATENGE